ncbi:MAG TPA: threonine synthase [Candidatus Ozemobacteraceae bacterium]|nr:threonine synthase [Candidatus Ozemobacteraceae bacterium]
MNYVSTKGNAPPVRVSEAVRAGLAPDGGLYIPAKRVDFPDAALSPDLEFSLRAQELLTPLFKGDPAAPLLPAICGEAFSFPVPLRWRSGTQAVLELFHGPTLAFKDVGARFLAAFLDRTAPAGAPPVTILVATSGDTGGAVAAAFAGKPSARVFVFFPKGRVSGRQRAQLTCWGGNVAAFAVRGSFDDCQAMVREALAVPSLADRFRLTSANSINLGRLLPQVTYYAHAAAGFFARTGEKPLTIIPTGNVGNATAAFWARAWGAPMGEIVLAVNANRTIPDFLATGEYRPRPSVSTLANAMDVGNPSNLERLRHLFPDFDALRRAVRAYPVDDDEIRTTIRDVFSESGEVLCPHTAVAEQVRRRHFPDRPAIIVATAHPAKFETIVEPLIGRPVPVPPALAELLARPGFEQELDPAGIGISDWERLLA